MSEYIHPNLEAIQKEELLRSITLGTDTLPVAEAGTELSKSSEWIADLFNDPQNLALMNIPDQIRFWGIDIRSRYWENAEPDSFKRALIERKIFHELNVDNKAYELVEKISGYDWNIRQVQVNADLHDVARPAQGYHYLTYNDDISFNHALVGAYMVSHAQLPFVENGCDEGVAVNAVKTHSDRTCPDNPYFHLLRDADKLIITQEYIEDLELEIQKAQQNGKDLELSTIDAEAIAQLKEGKSIENRLARKSKANRILQRIAWINDFKFDAAKKDFIESESLQKLLYLLNKFTGNGNDHIYEIVNERLTTVFGGEFLQNPYKLEEV